MITSDGLTKRQRYLKRYAALKTERSSWEPQWKDLTEYIQPRRGRFFRSDANKGTKKGSKIINNKPTRAARILAAGMMAGLTSPARPWFRLTTPDPEMAEVGSVRGWLHVVEERIRQALARGNVYKSLANLYLDLGTPGVAAMVVEDDPLKILRAFVLPIGDYYLALDENGRVDTLYRSVSMTARQLLKKFGRENCSVAVQNAIDVGNVYAWFDVLHVIEPNSDYQHGRMGAVGMRWSSCWMEEHAGCGPTGEGFLREGGYEEFPAMCPRWAVNGEDVYASSSPGIEALGDAKALQTLERRKGQLVEKLLNPPMRGPGSLRNMNYSLMPGDVTYVDSVAQGQTFEPSHEVDAHAVEVVEMSIRQHEGRCDQAYFADLWLMLAESDHRDVTAREVAERHEEKMLQLGPVLEQVEDELLEPLIDRVFAILLRNGDLPPPPEEMQGVQLRVEYTSVFAQAQKLAEISKNERLAGFIGNLSASFPDIKDKLNTDQLVDEYAASLGTKPELVRSDEEVAKIRQQRAQAQQQAAAADQAMAAVQGAKLLSETDTTRPSALTDLAGTIGGPAATQGIGRA